MARVAATTIALGIGLATTTQFCWPWRAAKWQRSPIDSAGASARNVAKDASVSEILRQSASGDLYTTIDASYRINFPDAGIRTHHVAGASGRLYYESEFWRRMTLCADAPDSKRDLVRLASASVTSAATTAKATGHEIDTAAFNRAWFMCRDDRGSYHMTVTPDAAVVLEAIERLAQKKGRGSRDAKASDRGSGCGYQSALSLADDIRRRKLN